MKLNKLVKHFSKNEGWTFIETIIGIAIVLLLSSGVGAVAIKNLDKASVTVAKSQIGDFKLALEMYRYDCNRYPTTEQGLDALWKKPHFSPVPLNWDGPYIDKNVPKDPWNSSYVYKAPGENGLPFTISSLGGDSLTGGTGKNRDIHSYD